MGEFKLEVLKTMGTLITTAFGLIAALAWNEAIKALITQFFKQAMNSQDYLSMHSL